VLSPLFLQWVVDHALISADRDLLLTLALGFGLLVLLRTAVSAMRGWILIVLGASLKVQGRSNLFSHLINLPTAYFEARHLGDEGPFPLAKRRGLLPNRGYAVHAHTNACSATPEYFERSQAPPVSEACERGMLRASGSSSAMVATGPTPGSTPMAVPMMAPTRHQNMLIGTGT